MVRPIVTVPLPGDADTVLEYEIARAIRRDNRLNRWERRVLFFVCWCEESKRKYAGGWRCSYWRPCCYCEEIYRTD